MSDMLQQLDAPDPRGAATLEVSDLYPAALDRLIYGQDAEKGVTQYYGGPLDLPYESEVWLSPATVVEPNGTMSYLQVYYVNTRPDQALNDSTIPVHRLTLDETSQKMALSTGEDYSLLQGQLDTDPDEKKILVRLCDSGMAAFPNPFAPFADTETDHLERLVTTLGLGEPQSSIEIGRKRGDGLEFLGRELGDGVEIGFAKTIPFQGSEIYAYGVNVANDPWGYYEVLSPVPITEIGGNSDEDGGVVVRVDSGCDIGQIFDDRGCDCREQMHLTLEQMTKEGAGVVLHIPSQDGRGYGAATKMETEALKSGVPAVFESPPDGVDTVTAAHLVFGPERYDIRNYAGAALVLQALGHGAVRLNTDNRAKIQGLERGGISVTRRPTGTTGSNGSANHLAAKHATVQYISD